MKIENMFPAMPNSVRKCAVHTFLSAYEFVLSTPESEVLAFVKDNIDDVNIDVFPNIKHKIGK